MSAAFWGLLFIVLNVAGFLLYAPLSLLVLKNKPAVKWYQQ